MALSLVICAIGSEVVVTLLYGEQVKFPRHVVGAPWGLRINEPHAKYRHKSADVSVWFEINGQGMRANRDYAYEKPIGTKRIASLGDSFTTGYEVEFEETFSHVLESRLREGGVDVEVMNAGVSGFSTAEEYLYLERELSKYDPDLVLVSFYANDYVDNLRTGLFRLEDGKLVPAERAYVPGGRLGNFLNTNPVLSWLSGYSNAFAFVKERVNWLLKRRLVRRNLRQVADAGNAIAIDAEVNGRSAGTVYEKTLAVALFEKMYQWTRAHDVPLVIQSIPFQQREPLMLLDLFPTEFDLDRAGLYYLSGKELLEPYLHEELLFWTRSHWHWTPFSHQKSGKALAELILADALLGPSAQ